MFRCLFGVLNFDTGDLELIIIILHRVEFLTNFIIVLMLIRSNELKKMILILIVEVN